MAHGESRPELEGGSVDFELVDDWQAQLPLLYSGRRDAPLPGTAPPSESTARIAALESWEQGDLAGTLRYWRSQPRAPRTPLEATALAEALADRGDDAALPLVARVRAYSPVDADALRARFHWSRGDLADAVEAVESTLRGYQRDPWATQHLVARTFSIVPLIAAKDRAAGRRFFELLGAPFAAEVQRRVRLNLRLDVADAVDARALCAEALAAFEPNVPWGRAFLERRATCYAAVDSPLLTRAAEDLEAFARDESLPFGAGLPQPDPQQIR